MEMIRRRTLLAAATVFPFRPRFRKPPRPGGYTTTYSKTY